MMFIRDRSDLPPLSQCWLLVLASLCFLAQGGCWAPFRSPAVPACSLPDEFRMPTRIVGDPLNFATLTVPPPADYLLGTGDVLELTVAGLYEGAEFRPLRLQLMADGRIHLPLVGSLHVGGMNLVQAQEAISAAYADGYLKSPRVNLSLFDKAKVNIVVLGEVKLPGAHPLNKFENDVGHALAAAGGLTRDAGEVIEVHRRIRSPATTVSPERLPSPFGEAKMPQHWELQEAQAAPLPGLPDDGNLEVIRIPLRTIPGEGVQLSQMVLGPGDVIVVPSRNNEVFFVVGKLGTTNLVRFTLGDRERELGTGFILPRDREVDVVTAVAMAGYIDPIDSPTTVTVHRTMPDGRPFLIHVDLIKARFDAKETILVQKGDIIYLNPDAPWYFRRTMDRIVGDIFLIPYAKLIGR